MAHQTIDGFQGGTPALEAVGLSKKYGSVQALADVSFTAQPGEILAICGENGAGKSTLMKVISGLTAPDTGTLLLAGVNAQLDSGSERGDSGITVVPQELTLCKDLSVAENIALGRLPTARGAVRWGEVTSDAKARLNRLGLGSLNVARRVGDLSVAEQAFVQIARAITPTTKILIVDEPTAPLSSHESDTLLAVMRQVASSGVTILFITHRLDEVLQVCDRALVLRDGRLVAELPAESMSRAALVSAMVGDADLSVPARAASSTEDALLTVEALVGASLRDITFTVSRGEIVGVYGQLGSGREELGPLIAGAAKPRAGGITVGGRQLRGGDVRDAIGGGIGYVPAERRSSGLALDQSIADNILLGMIGATARHGVRRHRLERTIAQRWVTQLAISTPSTQTPVGSLSGGGQQKVLIARWLAADSKMLVLDEPTRGVDVATKAAIYRILAEQAQRGAGVLVVSSDLEEIVTVASRVLVIRDGHIVADLQSPKDTTVAAFALGGSASETER